MRLHQEIKRLKDTKAAISATRLSFGPNKKQELIRLIYEISKRDNIPPAAIFKKAIKQKEFNNTKQAFTFLKRYFLKERFPDSYEDSKNSKFYLPKIEVKDKYSVFKKNSFNFYPQKIFIENEVRDSYIAQAILKKFPQAKQIFIGSLKNYQKSIQNKTHIDSYNSRADNLFLIKERIDFIKPCPCTKGALGCGYYILNLGFGCPYECSYCFLQSYTNVSGIILPTNIEDYLSNLELFLKKNPGQLRIGTGEFTDSLVLDDLTGYSQILIEFFSRINMATLELKTKSDNINNILKVKHNRRTVISWSLNPQQIIDSDEWQANNLAERLSAAQKCCDAGYLVGFHFDPIIYSFDWENLYKELLNRLFKKIDPANIAWISLGTFRFAPRLKTIIEQRFPQSKILNEELILDFDKKLRYSQQLRTHIYKKMLSWIRKYSSSVFVYLCMEPKKFVKKF